MPRISNPSDFRNEALNRRVFATGAFRRVVATGAFRRAFTSGAFRGSTVRARLAA